MTPENIPRPAPALEALHQLLDEDLVVLLVGGNHDAMRVIFDRYYPVVMRVALRIVRDAGEAEDVVQITFTDFYRNAKLFDATKGSLRTWLLQYSYGRAINRLKSLKVRSHFNHVDLEDVDLPSAPNSAELFHLSRDEARLFVQQVLASLNDRHRRIVELVCFDGLTIPEVAWLTGESVGNVQHYYHRTIEKLRAAFRKLPSEEIPKAGKTKERRSVLEKAQRTSVLAKVKRSAAAFAKEVENVRAQLL